MPVAVACACVCVCVLHAIGLEWLQVHVYVCPRTPSLRVPGPAASGRRPGSGPTTMAWMGLGQRWSFAPARGSLASLERFVQFRLNHRIPKPARAGVACRGYMSVSLYKVRMAKIGLSLVRLAGYRATRCVYMGREGSPPPRCPNTYVHAAVFFFFLSSRLFISSLPLWVSTCVLQSASSL